MITALIFDFDGTILDTESAHLRAWQEIYAEHGYPFPMDTWSAAVGGHGGLEVYEHFERLHGAAVDREALRMRRRTRMLELVADQPLLPGIAACLDDARRHGMRLAIASNSSYDWVDSHLRRLNLRERFETLSCVSHDVPPKPEPHIYRRALMGLGAHAADAIAIEDSLAGVAAARAAGIFTVFVPNAFIGARACESDPRLGTLAEMPLARLLEQVRRT